MQEQADSLEALISSKSQTKTKSSKKQFSVKGLPSYIAHPAFTQLVPPMRVYNAVLEQSKQASFRNFIFEQKLE